MFRRILLIVVLSCVYSVNTQAALLTTLSLVEKDSITTSNYPLTFGHVFKRGDVSQYVQVRYNGTLLTTQCDVKTTYDDGSVRFAVISVILPSISSGSANTIALETSSATASSGYMDKAAILATNVESETRLTNLSGSGYSGGLTADLNAKISADTIPKYWLQGSVATEILVQQALNDSLESSWEVRFYPGTSFGPRISHSIENMNADYRGIINYDVDIQAGLPTLSSRYSKTSVQHNENSRWRKVLWIGPEPPETELHYDAAYLISTGAMMNYDRTAGISETSISQAYTKWNSSNHDIMGSGTIQKYFPSTGGREDVGILPTWSVRYLLSMDNRMREIVIGNGEMSEHAPFHYRESNSSKAFFRHPISINDRPTVRTTKDYAATGGNAGDNLPMAIGNEGTSYHGWEIDRAHQPSFSYIPYLITGERYFLDGMYYWAAWDFSQSHYDPNWGRNYSVGIIQDQVRGEAWGLRNVADAVAFACDSDIEKSYLLSKLGNNITKWMSEKDRYPLNYWSIDTTATKDGMTSDVKYVGSAWMEDYMLISLVHAREQRFNTDQIISWYKKFNSGRFTGVGVNPYDGASYRFPAQLTDNSYPLSWADFASKYATPQTSWVAPTSGGHDYKLIALAAASVAGNTSAAAWIRGALEAGGMNWAVFADDPTWYFSVAPSDISSCSDGIQNGDETGVDCGGSCAACSNPSSLHPWAISGRAVATSGRPVSQ